MGRILSLDFGSRTMGLAITDPLKTIAYPLEIIRRKREGQLRDTLRKIVELIKAYEVERIVLGYPLNMDGSKGERALKTEEFKETLDHRLFHLELDVPVVMWDERLSTVGAEEVLMEIGNPKAEREHIDSIAAALILRDYLDNGTGS